VPQWLTVAGSRLDKVIEFYQFILPATLRPGVYSASLRMEYETEIKMFLRNRARSVRELDNFTAM
jgi:hypothetical protein